MYFSYDQVNINQGTRVFSESDVLRKNLNKDVYNLSIDLEKKTVNQLYDSLIEYADKNDMSYLINYVVSDEEGEINYNEKIIYSKNDNILNGYHIDKKEDIDFSDIYSKKYYSTEKDEQSAGYIRILDNDLFIQSEDVFRFRNFAYIKDIIENDFSNIFMQVYADNKTQLNELIDYLHHINDDFVIEFVQMEGSGIVSDNNIIRQNSQKIIGFIALCIIAIMVSLIVKNNRKYVIEKMLGKSSFVIVLKEFGYLFLSIFIVFGLSSFLFFYLFCKEINDLSIVLFQQVIVSTIYCLCIIVIIFVLTVVFISYICSVKYIHSKSQLNNMIFIQMCIKVIVILLMIVPFLDTLNNAFPYLNNYIATQHMKEDANQYYYLKSIPSDDMKIYRHFINTEHYIDFSLFYNNSTMNEMTVASAIENGYYDNLYRYPFISANKKVISELSLKDENGKAIDVNSLTYKSALIPIEYKNKDLSLYQLDLKDIIYIENYDKIYNYKFENPFYLKNPMIMVMTEDSTNIQIMSLRFKGENAKEVQKSIYQVSNSEQSDLRLRSSQYKMNFYLTMLDRSMIEVGLILGVYFFISLIIIVQTFYIYVDGDAKYLSISYMMGHHRLKRYSTLLIYNFLSYVAVFIGMTQLNLNLEYALYCLLVIALIELSYNCISLGLYEKKHISDILKGYYGFE